ncbi:hypothetical protein MM300_20180 [Evansella sp. LMS18]|nr:hypothetical protein [Evansella sp. LMS18]UTR10167.1 hypothetical protein MM300_20180 [Evansella sp. LMS18]
MMENKKQLSILKEEFNGSGNGYKIINEEIKDQPENIWAVCTPVKTQ